MARVSDEILRAVRSELSEFKQASGQSSAAAAADLAGSVEALLNEAEWEHQTPYSGCSAAPRR